MMCCQLMRASAALFLLAVYTQAEERGREPPSIQEPRTRSEKFVRRNQDVFLQCTAVGYPAIAYEWYWNDSPIQSTVITFDANTGTLQIQKITEREEGFFNCRAKNTYNGQEAIAISPKIEVRIARVGDFPPTTSAPMYTYTEGGYAKVPCDEQMPEHYGPTTFKWYKPIGAKLDEVIPNERIFIDQEGSVHFAYITKSDENLAGNREYQCAMSNSIADTIKLGRGRQVAITAVATGIPEKKPASEYSTHGPLLTVQRNANAQLECFFSGYENAAMNAGKVPKVTWYDNQNNKISTGGRYQLDSDNRVLIIKNVIEEDEKTYTCEGSNTLGATRQQLILNVTSTPIWVDALKSMTAVQGTNAIFNCLSRSAVSELAPGPPEWYKNGNRMGSSTDPTKYIWSDQNTKMTVKYVTKDRDIACFQCYVQNSVGIEFSAGCLNVILPITVTVQPDNLDQEISRGDIVNLTVVAISDPLTPIKYRWIYKNVTFELNNAPPHVIYDDVTKLAYINTSLLTDQEYASLDGLYRREIYHQYEHKFIDVMVSRKESPTAPPVVSTAGFDYWIIGLIIGILIILIVIIIIVCVICRRKMQEGQYPLGKKETAAGLDPEKDIKDSGFHDLSRADYDDYPEKGKLPAGPIDFEDIPIGVDDDDDFEGEYGEEATAFNEDGSFIGVYTRDNKNKASQPPPYSAGGGGGPEGPTESNV